MPKFTFRLQTLLKLRDQARDGRRAELAKAYEAERVLNGKKEELAGQQEELARSIREQSQPGVVDVDALLNMHRHEAMLSAHQRTLAQQYERLAPEIERRRQALVEADRQVKVLEKLKDKQQRRHREQEDRREAKVLDEVASRCNRPEDNE